MRERELLRAVFNVTMILVTRVEFNQGPGVSDGIHGYFRLRSAESPDEKGSAEARWRIDKGFGGHPNMR